jgi:hypothetical protein
MATKRGIIAITTLAVSLQFDGGEEGVFAHKDL